MAYDFSQLAQLPRLPRPWLIPLETDPDWFYQLIDQIPDQAKEEIADHTAYHWAGQHEDLRLRVQNLHLGYNLADHHARYLLKLAELGFKPASILTVGAGKDASIVENLINAWPAADITVVEINPAKVTGAQDTLSQLGYSLNRLHFVTGNAADADLMAGLGLFDLVEANCLVQHLPTVPPDYLPDAMKAGFPTLNRLLNNLADRLNPNGLTVIGDLLATYWDIRPKPEYQDDPAVQQLYLPARTYIHGEPDGFQGIMTVAWRGRKASVFSQAEEIAETVTIHSNRRLIPIIGSASTFAAPSFDRNSPYAVGLAFIPYTAAAGVHMSLAQDFQLLAAIEAGRIDHNPNIIKAVIAQKQDIENDLWSLGSAYLKAHQDSRFQLDYPRHTVQLFRAS